MEDKRFFIGVDIGGTSTKIALVDDSGEITGIEQVLTKGTQPEIKDFLKRVLQKVQTIYQTCSHEVKGIGIATPGLQQPDGCGTLYSVNIPVLNGFNLVQFFNRHFQIPVNITNDLVAHSLAENQFGSGKGVNRFLCVALGTGIGHTFINNGQPTITLNGISGDSGRMILDVQSAVSDSSGMFGTAEALCGVKAIELLARTYYTTEYHVSAREVIVSAREGNDPIAREILKVISSRLAHYLINLATIYFPDVISITGGQTEAGDFFIDECQKEFTRLSAGFFESYYRMIGEERKIKIVKAKAGGLAGLLGSIIPLLS